jgi:hypothetical protein
MKRFSVIVVGLVLLTAACSGDGGVTTAPPDGSEAPATTAAPATTQAPDTTSPATSTTVPGGDSDTPWWLLIVIGLALLILIVALVGRGNKKVIVAAPVATWKDNARKGYADARWMYDAMGEDMAVWRGNAQFDGSTAVDASAATNKAATWSELQTRFGTASDALYALEAGAPDTKSADAARSTIATMKTTRDAIDARAEARFGYRTSETAGADQAALVEARDREVRASRNLTEARNTFARALTDLSTLV